MSLSQGPPDVSSGVPLGTADTILLTIPLDNVFEICYNENIS